MPKIYGDAVVGNVRQGRVIIVAGEWRLLSANGSSNFSGRRHIRLQTQGKPGNAVAVAYAATNSDNGFTTPTDQIKTCTVFRGTATWVEPLSDKVSIYGRLNAKAGATENSVAVICTEYA